MKRVFYVLMVVTLFLMLSASSCERSSENVDRYFGDRFECIESNYRFGGGSYTVIVDTETNVLYLWVVDGYQGGLTPLLDSNGEVQFYQK